MKQLVTLEGRTVIVTGAAQGIGKACCELALELGANTVGIDLNAEGVAALGKDRSDGRYLSFVGSVTDPKFVESTCAAIVERFGAIHGLVNNAGVIRPAMIEKMTLEQWQTVIDVHMTGSFLWLQVPAATWSSEPRPARRTPARSSTSRPTPASAARSAKSTMQRRRPACSA